MRVLLTAMTGMGNAALSALRTAGIEVVAVIADPLPGPGFPHYPCKELFDQCLAWRIPVWPGMSLRSTANARRIRNVGVDAFIIATSHKIVSQDLVDAMEGRVINCHPSLLPRHRGPTPVAWTIECGDRETGLTFIQPTAEIDAGPVWYQCRTPVGSTETAGSLRQRLDWSILPSVLPEVVEGVVTGRLQPMPQQGAPTYEPRFREADIEWGNETAESCLRRFRARTPHPGVFIRYSGRRYRVEALSATADRNGSCPGAIEQLGPGRFATHVTDALLTAEVAGCTEEQAVACAGQRK